MRRIISLFLLSLVAEPLAVHSVSDSLEKRLCALENRLSNGVNLPASLSPALFFNGEALYWNARQDGLEYIVRVELEDNSVFDYTIKNLEFDWDFGFRAGIGYDFKRDGWDFGAYWTHLWTDAENGGLLNAPRPAFPIWSNPNYAPFFFAVNEAKADWDLHFNQIDVFLGKAFYISKYFVLRPFIGPSGISITQDFNLKYVRALVGGTNYIHLDNNFQGIGVNGGSDLSFILGSGWSIFGKGGLGIYYGHFNLSRKETYPNIFGGGREFASKEKFHIDAPAAEMAFGLNWEHRFSNERSFIRARLLFEYEIFYSQNQLKRFIHPDPNASNTNFITNQGDLTLQGGTFSLTLGF